MTAAGGSRAAAAPYVFGSSAGEIARLQELGELLRPGTRQLLQQAGITAGMNVLDIGCGPWNARHSSAA